ncbi:MAG: MFS transporter [Sterolibacteriaceae bacterium MAG5]|nr:MFS transporter [Candidatus Nitricoxidireducens bremensis]
MHNNKNWRTPGLVLLCGGLIMTLAMGARHGFGLFLQPMSADHGWGRETFAFALALQNLVWGVATPFAGLIADRYGAGRVLLTGSVLYVIGLVWMAYAATGAELALSSGVLIGLGLSGTTFSIVYGVLGRIYPPEKRSMALGIAGAAGSFGQFAMLPATQALITGTGWLNALLVLAAVAALMAPLSAVLAEPDRGDAHHKRQPVREAIGEAAGHRGFWLLTFGYFVCGFQVVFIGVHLPAYLADHGLPGNVGVVCLALIGFFNIIGTYGAGWLGQRRSKKHLLAFIYVTRSVIIIAFLAAPLTPWSAYLFAAAIGTLWLATVPLTNGIVAQVFGVQYLSMLGGFVFFSHQIGSFLGAWMGGWLFDRTGSYDLVWTISIALGVVAMGLNIVINDRPLARLQAAPA